MHRHDRLGDEELRKLRLAGPGLIPLEQRQHRREFGRAQVQLVPASVL